MKKIIITRENDELAIFPSFDEMLRSQGYIGFTPDNHESRYMLVKTGSARGLAINPGGTWSSKEGQLTAVGYYYLFDSPQELLRWMSEC